MFDLVIENSGDPRRAKTKYNTATWTAARKKLALKLRFEQGLAEDERNAQIAAEERGAKRIAVLHRKLDAMAASIPASSKWVKTAQRKPGKYISPAQIKEANRVLRDCLLEHDRVQRMTRKTRAQIEREYQKRMDSGQLVSAFPKAWEANALPTDYLTLEQVFGPAKRPCNKQPLSPKALEHIKRWNAIVPEIQSHPLVGDAFREVLNDSGTRTFGPIPKKKNSEKKSE